MEIDPQIEQALLSGRRIAAIRRYRQLTGAGLRESRSAVIAMETQLRQAGRVVTPERPVAPRASGMRITLLVAIFVALVVLLAVLLVNNFSSH